MLVAGTQNRSVSFPIHGLASWEGKRVKENGLRVPKAVELLSACPKIQHQETDIRLRALVHSSEFKPRMAEKNAGRKQDEKIKGSAQGPIRTTTALRPTNGSFQVYNYYR
jgi:hypothetical protein